MEKWMVDLAELGRLKDRGLLTEDEFEIARREIFLNRPRHSESDAMQLEVAQQEGSLYKTPTDQASDDVDGWWQASDGQWYPPEAMVSVVEQGWWQASDGQWYPPEARRNDLAHANSDRIPEGAALAFPADRSNAPLTSDDRLTTRPVTPSFDHQPSPSDRSSSADLSNLGVPSGSPERHRASKRKSRILWVAGTVAVSSIIGGLIAISQPKTTLPVSMEPVREAVLSSTFGPWEEAQVAFTSDGAEKWRALTGLYRAYFQKSNVGAKRESGISRQGDWYVIEYCSVQECETGQNVFQLHLHLGESDKIDDLRWFRGPEDAQVETRFYRTQLDPDYVYDDPLQAYAEGGLRVALRPGIDFDYAVQDRDSGCLIGKVITPPGYIKGEITIDGNDVSSVTEWTVYFNLDSRVTTRDGLELGLNNDGHPRQLTVRESGELNVLFCTDYEISEVTGFLIPGGEWNIVRDGDLMSYTQDFVVPFEVIEL